MVRFHSFFTIEQAGLLNNEEANIVVHDRYGSGSHPFQHRNPYEMESETPSEFSKDESKPEKEGSKRPERPREAHRCRSRRFAT